MKKEKNRARFSLKYKFSLAMVFLSASLVASVSWFFMKDEISIMTRSIEDYASRETVNLANIAEDALSTENDLAIGVAVDNILKSGKMKDSIRYVHVFNTEGLVIKSSKTELNGTVLDKSSVRDILSYGEKNIVRKVSITDSEDPEGKIFDFALPVYHRTQKEMKLAVVRLGFSDKMIREQVKRIRNMAGFITLAAVIGSIIIAFFLAHVTTKPLKTLSKGVSIIGKGDLDYKINVKTRDEIGLLAREFNLMTGELKDSKKNEIESALMQEQLDVAKEIQEGLNPMNFYDKNGIQIKGYTRAAKGVGGDYFDYKEIDENRVGALISDVSGKGIPASLVMVMIRTVFVSALHQMKTIQCAKIVSSINRSLSADFAIDKFATLLFIIFDKSTGKISFSNAGHGPVFCYRAKHKKCSLTKRDGVPIGIMEDSEYLQAEIPFEVGDIVVMYTDGITEMRNSLKEEYGRNRLQNLVASNADMNADELNRLIVDDVDNFRGEVPPHDDMTVLIMKRTA